MPKVIFENKSYPNKPDETVLDTLIRSGINVPFSCKAGICHTCTMQLLNGRIEKESYKGLAKKELNNSEFLPCQCYPNDDIEICALPQSSQFQQVKVQSKQLIEDDILRLIIEPKNHFHFHGGQFINLRNSLGVIRSYSIANILHAGGEIELHIKCITGGTMSEWLFLTKAEDMELEVQGPFGDCHYHFEVNRNLLLISTGTGLAPLIGIISEAFNNKHQGHISLYHSAKEEAGIYLHKELIALSTKHDNFSYHASVYGAESDNCSEFPLGSSSDFAFGSVNDLQNWEVHLCGNPNMVYKAQAKALSLKADPDHVFFDAFETTHADTIDPATSYDEGDVYPDPEPDIWKALQEGKILRKILTDFYDVVYEDPILAPYFTEASRRHVISKQYSFLYKAFTGEDVYFGDKPRNAHHWMVISDEIFDHREKLFEDALIKNGIPLKIRTRWLQIHESYRVYMVKNKPWPRILHGIKQPIDGFDQIKLDLDFLCDSCEVELLKGETVLYHLGNGQIFCDKCSSSSVDN